MTPKTKTLIVIIASFILGCVVGATLLSGVWRSMTKRPYDRGNYRTYLYEKLDLDSLQTGRVDSLLDAFRASMNSHKQALQGSRDSLRSEIRALLSEPQKAVYDAIVADMDKRDSRRGPDSLRTKQ